MFIQVSSKNTTAQNPTTPFAKKWLEIEKKQKRNNNFKTKIDSLYQTFQDEVLPEEKKLIELLGKETQHLMTFMPRKSFTQWQREELQEWIESNLDTLDSNPFKDAELTSKLHQAYAEVLRNHTEQLGDDFVPNEHDLKGVREVVEEIFGDKHKFTREKLIDFLRDPALFQQYLQEFMQSQQEENDTSEFENDPFFNEDDNDNDNEYDNFYENYFNQQHTDKQIKQQNKLKSIFNNSKLNKLYKILANRLHPDKETNIHLKEEKSKLMAQLVTAKKNKDAFSIISMFHQYVPESELTLFDGSDEDLSAGLLSLLNEKLRILDQENRDIKYNNGLPSMIWQKLGGRGKKNIDRNIACHIADLEESQTSLRYIIDEVKTVKSLKQILSERYDQRSFSPFF
ncbi:MAG: hypothetical protein HRT37_19750 [Alteromonadaceae bacterium]|nr:hypothetical protein [Alteromonadaceae bacterium]